VSLRNKFLAVLIVPVVVLVASTTLLVLSRHRTNATLGAEREAYLIRDAVQAIQNDLVDAETGMRGYLLTGDDSFLEPYDTGVGRIGSDLDALEELTSVDGSQIGRIERLRTMAYERIHLLSGLRPFVPVTERTDQEQLSKQLELGREAMDEIRVLLSELQDRTDELLAERTRDLDTMRRVSFLLAIGGTPIAVLVSFVLLLFLARGAGARIGAMEANADRMQNGLPLLPARPRDDELGRLEAALIESGTRVVELQGELQRQATLDPLTRLPNRRGFVPMAEHRLEVAKRNHQPLALMFVDVDGLKGVNDTLGHATGDWLIAETAYVLRTTFRASDLIARMGGDEFCILFAAETDAAVEGAARRLQTAMDRSNRDPERPFRLSLSAGVSRFDPEDPRTLDELMGVADERMYVKKRARQAAGASSVRDAGEPGPAGAEAPGAEPAGAEPAGAEPSRG
jgi:diguanylate cyclase (GGDEF)-like protein